MAIRKDIRDTVGNDGRSGVADDLDLRSTGDGVGPATPEENLLLAKLPPEELKAFTAKAEKVTLKTRDVLFENGDAITTVYFPVTAMISLLSVLAGGPSIEAITVGHEGAAGLPLFHGVKTSFVRAVCQIGGDAYKISAGDFESLLETSPALTAMLHKYAQFTQDSIAQSAACNSIHLIEQRCARWLLLSADAVRNAHFSLTQEFFAQMLAVRRSGVTTAMGGLERKNLVTGRYGTITIVDREGLTRIACECYNSVKARRNELLA
jgi:CRP-like cAMP-binding protein